MIRFQTFNNARDTKLVIAFGAVKRSNDQVDDGQVEEFGLRVLQTLLFFFLLQFAEQLLSFFVL